MVDGKKLEHTHSHFGNQLHGREGIHPLRTRVASNFTLAPTFGAPPPQGHNKFPRLCLLRVTIHQSRITGFLIEHDND